MTQNVTIVYYQVGNIKSVQRAFEYFHADVKVVNSPQEIASADRLVLPGVGAFNAGMQELSKLGFYEAIKSFCMKQRPFLGICLGMQMMLDVSEEFGTHNGLSLIEGEVKAVPPTATDGSYHKIPHIGWNQLIKPSINTDWNNTILKNTTEHSSVYFVHSFHAVPKDPSNILAQTNYNGQLITAIIYKDFLFGCQFHPEKSGNIGLNMIRNFLEL